jgi:hypothetical protein
MLNTAWTFWTIGQIAYIAFFVLLGAGIVVLATLTFEVIEAVRGTESVSTVVVRAKGTRPVEQVVVKGEVASVN